MINNVYLPANTEQLKDSVIKIGQDIFASYKPLDDIKPVKDQYFEEMIEF